MRSCCDMLVAGVGAGWGIIVRVSVATCWWLVVGVDGCLVSVATCWWPVVGGDGCLVMVAW